MTMNPLQLLKTEEEEKEEDTPRHQHRLYIQKALNEFYHRGVNSDD